MSKHPIEEYRDMEELRKTIRSWYIPDELIFKAMKLITSIDFIRLMQVKFCDNKDTDWNIKMTIGDFQNNLSMITLQHVLDQQQKQSLAVSNKRWIKIDTRNSW